MTPTSARISRTKARMTESQSSLIFMAVSPVRDETRRVTEGNHRQQAAVGRSHGEHGSPRHARASLILSLHLLRLSSRVLSYSGQAGPVPVCAPSADCRPLTRSCSLAVCRRFVDAPKAGIVAAMHWRSPTTVSASALVLGLAPGAAAHHLLAEGSFNPLRIGHATCFVELRHQAWGSLVVDQHLPAIGWVIRIRAKERETPFLYIAGHIGNTIAAIALG